MAEIADHHWWFVGRRKILSTYIQRCVFLPPNARVLEIGCGTGHNLKMLSAFGHVDATELDEDSRKIASARLGREVLGASLPALSGVAVKYDLIALLDVLEHVEDDIGALQSLWPHLRPGGSVLVTVPAHAWLWSAHDNQHHHFRRYSFAELRSKIRAAGYSLKYASYFNSILFPIICAMRLVARVAGRDEADDKMPSKLANTVLTKTFGLEAKLVGRIKMPFGVSILATFGKAV